MNKYERLSRSARRRRRDAKNREKNILRKVTEALDGEAPWRKQWRIDHAPRF